MRQTKLFKKTLVSIALFSCFAAQSAIIDSGSNYLPEDTDNYIGIDTAGSLEINGGSVFERTRQNLYVGLDANGQLIIKDPNSKMVVGGEGGSAVDIGGAWWHPSGRGSVDISDGGTLEVHSSVAEQFSGSRIRLGIGKNSLNVTSGGKILMTNYVSDTDEAVLQVGVSDQSGVLSDASMVVDGDFSKVDIFTANTVGAINVGTTGLDGVSKNTITGRATFSNGGMLNIHSGSTGTYMNVGRGEDATGYLEVTGNGSSVNGTGRFTVLYTGFTYNTEGLEGGTGTVNINNKAIVNLEGTDYNGARFGWRGIGDLQMNDGTLNVGTVDLGEQEDDNRDLVIGLSESGNGNANLTSSTVNIGHSNATSAFLGVGGQGATGNLVMNDSSINITATNAFAFIGNSGDGTAILSNNSHIISSDRAIVGGFGTGNVIIFDDSSIRAANSLSIGEGGSVFVGLGPNDNSFIESQQIYVADGGYLGGSGDIKGSVTVANGGTVDAGNSPGHMDIFGDLIFEDGARWEFEISGDTINTYDTYAISGDLLFEGEIDIVFNFIDDFIPDLDSIFNLFEVAGDFSGFNDSVDFLVSGLGPGFDFSVDFINGTFVTTTTSVSAPSRVAVYSLLILIYIRLSKSVPKMDTKIS